MRNTLSSVQNKMNIKIAGTLTWKYHPRTIHEFLFASLVKKNKLAIIIANLHN